MAKVRLAVVGVGHLGQHHARIAADSPYSELVGVVDSREDRGREIADKFGCQYFKDLAEVLPSVDAVQVAAPTGHHQRLSERILQAGKHILMEKPLGASQQEAEKMLADLAKARLAHSGLIAAVGHLERYNPAITALREKGFKPRYLESVRVSPFPQRSTEVDVIMDVMIHDLDLVLALVGEKAKEITAVGIPVLTPFADVVNARVVFENGVVASFTSSRVARKTQRQMRAFGDKSYASVDFAAQKLEILKLDLTGTAPEIHGEEVDIQRAEPLRAELEAFYRACLGEETYLVQWPEAAEAIRVAHCIQQAVQASLRRWTETSAS